MRARRVVALVRKELRELRASPAAVAPVAIVTVICVAIPFLVLVVLPAATGRPLTADADIARVVERAIPRLPGLQALDPEGAVEAFLFQQFLVLLLIAPIIGAVSLAAYSVVGEKQGRTLEPLLTTPLTTVELLVGKVIASLLPSLAIELIGVAAFAAIAVVFARPGVAATLLTARSAVLVFVVGPIAALAALQATIAVSSRVSDPRSAQQIAVLVILPILGMLIGQIAGAFIVPVWVLWTGAGALLAAWILLILLSVALFDRERILTRH